MRPSEFCAIIEKGKPGPAYFLCGPDRYLHEECRAAVVASLPAGTREWCFTEIEFKAGQLGRELENAYQMPMLGGHSFVYWTDPEDFSHASDEDFDALDGYLKRPPGFSTILFAAYRPDRRRRLIQCLEKRAEGVDLQPLGRAEAVAWLRNTLRKSGVEISAELAERIVTRFEGSGSVARDAQRNKSVGVNLLWLRTEIEKLLVARAGAKRIEEQDLDLITAVREEHEIGKLLAALADRQLSKALMVLRELLAGKEPEALILWCIGDLFRQALKSAVAPAQQYRGWSRGSNPFSTYEIAPRAARAYVRDELALAIRHAHAADLAIKSSWKDSGLLLETLVWQIVAGKAAEGSAEWLEIAEAEAP
jgi:DNA polymerase III delta subunit